MGKAVLKAIKSRARYLLKYYKEKFTEDFVHNKTVLNSLKLQLTDVQRNTLAGFIGRKVRQSKAAQ